MILGIGIALVIAYLRSNKKPAKQTDNKQPSMHKDNEIDDLAKKLDLLNSRLGNLKKNK